MLDINLIREKPDILRKSLTDRQAGDFAGRRTPRTGRAPPRLDPGSGDFKSRTQQVIQGNRAHEGS